MFAGALLQENGCAVACIANPPAKLLQFRLEKLIIGTSRHIADPRLQRGQMSSDRVRNKLWRANTKFAPFPEIRARFNRGEKLLYSIDKLRRQSHPGCVSHDREQALAGARVVEPLDCRSQTVLRDADANLARGDLFHRVGFVENDEVVWKKITAFPLCLLVRTSQKHEEQCVIDDNHVRREKPFPCLLVKAIRLSATFRRADMRLAANLGPNFWIRLD